MNLQRCLVVCVRVNTWRSRVWCWWSQSVSVRLSSLHTRTCQLAPPSEMGCSSHCCLLFLLSQSPWNVQKTLYQTVWFLKQGKRKQFNFFGRYRGAGNMHKTGMHSSRMRNVRCSSHLGGGGGVSATPPPWTESHTCENITLPQLRCGL